MVWCDSVGMEFYGLGWLNTALRAVSGKSSDSPCFNMEAKKSNVTQKTISRLHLLIEIV